MILNARRVENKAKERHSPFGSGLAQQQCCDQKAGQDKEDLHPEPTRQSRPSGAAIVDRQDEQHGDRPHAVKTDEFPSGLILAEGQPWP